MTSSSEHPLPPSPPPPPPPPPRAFTYPPIIIILSILVLLAFFVGFFSIYFCRCFVQNLLCMWHIRGSATAAPAAGAAAAGRNGLDPSIVKSFPSFAYSTVKGYRVEKYGLECAICLLEFNDIDVLRLLPTCCHVFHQECIDLWLDSHTTCPVCRKNLTSPAAQSPEKSPSHENEPTPPPPQPPVDRHVSISITVKVENEDVRNKGKGVLSGLSDRTVLKYPRSFSTGHYMLDRNQENKSEEEDRFTLRLPPYVHSRILRGHNPSKSWSVFGEHKDKDKSLAVLPLSV